MNSITKAFDGKEVLLDCIGTIKETEETFNAVIKTNMFIDIKKQFNTIDIIFDTGKIVDKDTNTENKNIKHTFKIYEYELFRIINEVQCHTNFEIHIEDLVVSLHR